jgi:predicted nucleic acid-binding protein
MPGKTFLDTNILVYAHDQGSGEKQKIAKEIVKKLWVERTGVLSTQVLQEFFYIVTKKLKDPLNWAKAKEVVERLLNWQVMVNDGGSILGAIEIQKKYKYSFWDSLILQAAISAKTEILLSEDLQEGQQINSLKIINPFN